jgi:hypothetical protein
MAVLGKSRKWFWALFLVFMGTDVCRPDVKIIGLDVQNRWARIEITGRITKTDVENFAKLVALLRPNVELLDVNLDSPGGDVFAAMQIGEIVRRDWLMTSVPDEPPAKGCMSACVLILAAGAVRALGSDSRVGIHRPYFDQVLFAGLDRTQAKAKYDALSQSVAAYLAKMGMSERLHQEMMKVPSSGIRLLSYDESKALNLSGEDAGYSEWIRAKNVAKYGEEKMKEHDAWLMREKEYMARCTRSSSKFDEKLWLRCAEEFSASFPSPLKSQ